MREFLILWGSFLLDQATKKWAEARLPLNHRVEIVRNRLYFWHIKNDGIAYNRFSGERKKILLSTGTILGCYTALLLRRKRMGKGGTLPLALILGGGWGNFLDRLRTGRVTDFLHIPVKGKNAPIFNLADVWVVLGALGLLMVSLREK